MEWRPSAAMVRPALICILPPGPLASTPADAVAFRPGPAGPWPRFPSAGGNWEASCASPARKSRKSHCGIRAMNLQTVGRRAKSPTVKCSSPISRLAVLDLGVRQLEEVLQQPQLMHDLQGRGMHRVAAEIAQEVLVLFQHRHIHPGAGQKIAQHHAGRAAAGDHACGGNRLQPCCPLALPGCMV